MIWWDSTEPRVNPHFSTRQKREVHQNKMRYITIYWNQSAENGQQWDQLGRQDWLSQDLLQHFSRLPSWQQNPPLLEFHFRQKKQSSVVTGDIYSLKYTSFFLSLSYLSSIAGNKPLLLCSLNFKELETFLTVNGAGAQNKQQHV